MTEESTLGIQRSTIQMMSESTEKLTVYAPNEVITEYLNRTQKACGIRKLWTSPQKLVNSFAFPKNSSLVPFFNHVVFNFKENGVIYRLTKKWIHEVKRDNGRSFECKQQKKERFECHACSNFHFHGAQSNVNLRQAVSAIDMFNGALYDLV